MFWLGLTPGVFSLRTRFKDIDKDKKGKIVFAFVIPYGRAFNCPAPETLVDREPFDFVILELKLGQCMQPPQSYRHHLTPYHLDYAEFFKADQPEREDGPVALPADPEMADPEEGS